MDIFHFCNTSHLKPVTWKSKMSHIGILALAIALVSCVQGKEDVDHSRSDYAYKRTKQIVSVVQEAAALIKRQGEEVFPLFRKKGSKWFQGDMYLFIYDLNGTNVVHPVQPEFEGKDLIDLQDINGKPVIRLIINKVTKHDRPSGWVHYMWIRPEEIFPMWKSSYVLRTRAPSGQEYVVGSGIYNMKVEKQFIVEMVDDAVELIKLEGKEAFDKFRDKSSEFVFLATLSSSSIWMELRLLTRLFRRWKDGTCAILKMPWEDTLSVKCWKKLKSSREIQPGSHICGPGPVRSNHQGG